MPKPQHIHKAVGYVTPERKDAPQNQRVLTEVCRLVEEMLVGEYYGELVLNLNVQDGMLQNDITVTYRRKVRCGP